LDKRILLSPPHLSGEEEAYVREAFQSNWIAPLGPHVDSFEKELCRYTGVPGALALNSGTAAVHLALRLAGVRQGERVVCSTLTFVGSVNPVLYLGGEPVFIDSEPGSWNMSPEALQRALEEMNKENRLPRAAVVVNIYGQCADMDSINQICRRYGITVIEDAAESLGATYRGKMSGNLGYYGIFSFNGNKIITTSGGGALVSQDREAIEKARFWSTQAREPEAHYQHCEVGYNYRMSNLLAAVGRAQLKVINDRIERRRCIFENYRRELSDIEVIDFMPEAEFGRSTRWLTVLTLEEGCGIEVSDILSNLAERNIEARPVWKPMHLQPLYQGCIYYPHETGRSISDAMFRQGICLPSGSALTGEEQQRVIEGIRSVFSR